jgi:hypothetical protein
MPAPTAPAALKAARLCGRRRPPAASPCPGGNTARQAFSTGGPSISAGNSFSASAPAARALKPSLGVATPGTDQQAALALHCRTTAASKFGASTRRPPASATRSASAAVSTVPAPTSTWSPQAPRQAFDAVAAGG